MEPKTTVRGLTARDTRDVKHDRKGVASPSAEPTPPSAKAERPAPITGPQSDALHETISRIEQKVKKLLVRGDKTKAVTTPAALWQPKPPENR
jgi:hypothetical protein